MSDLSLYGIVKHCAFVERPHGEYDGYWAERMVVRFAADVVNRAPR